MLEKRLGFVILKVCVRRERERWMDGRGYSLIIVLFFIRNNDV